MKISPARPRAHLGSILGGVRFSVPTRRNVLVLLFLPVWLCGWAAGEVAALGTIARGLSPAPGTHGPPIPFLLVWVAFWTVGGGLAMVSLVWNAFGREVVELDGRSLRIRREAFGLGFTAEYAVADVRALRVSPAPIDPLRGGLRGWGVGGGVIAFDHGARTVRFCAGVDEAEAKALVEALAARLPVDDAVRLARS